MAGKSIFKRLKQTKEDGESPQWESKELEINTTHDH